MTTILIADTDADVRAEAKALLSNLGHKVLLARSPLEALHKAERTPPSIAILDGALSEFETLTGQMRILKGGRNCRILASLAKADLKALMRLRAQGADDVILKPFDAKVFSALFGRAVIVAHKVA